MNKEEVIKKLNEYSSECHTQLAYAINGYKRKHPGDLRLCMYEVDAILNHIEQLQHKLEEKQKVIDEAIEYMDMVAEIGSYSNSKSICGEDFDELYEILERGKNEQN